MRCGAWWIALVLLLTLGCGGREEEGSRAAIPGGDRIELVDGRVRLDVSEADQWSVLQGLADLGGFDLELHEISPRRVTLRLDDATLAEALTAIVGDAAFRLDYAYDPRLARHVVAALHVGAMRAPSIGASTRASTALAGGSARPAAEEDERNRGTTREPSSRQQIESARERIARVRDRMRRAEGAELWELQGEYGRAKDALQEQLRAALLDPDPTVREEALEEVATQEGDARARVASLAQEDPDPRIRLAAIEALAEDGTFQAVTELVTMLDDPEPQVLLATLEALELNGDESIAPLIQPLAGHSDVQVREKAGEMLEFWTD